MTNKNQKIELKVEGMHCKSCAMLIEEALTEIDIKISKVDLNLKTIEVIYDGTKDTLSRIKKIIKEEGYKVI